MNLFGKLKSTLKSYQGKKARRKAHLKWVEQDITTLKFSIINLSIRYGMQEISDSGFCRRAKNRAVLLVRRERYLSKIKRFI